MEAGGPLPRRSSTSAPLTCVTFTVSSAPTPVRPWCVTTDTNGQAQFVLPSSFIAYRRSRRRAYHDPTCADTADWLGRPVNIGVDEGLTISTAASPKFSITVGTPSHGR